MLLAAAVAYASGGVRSWELGDDPVALACNYGAVAIGMVGVGMLIARWLRRPAAKRTPIPSGPHARPARQSLWVLGGVLLCASALALQAVPRVRDDGWLAAPPATALLAVVQWTPGTAVWNCLEQKHESLWGWQRRWLISKILHDVGGEPTAERLKRANHHQWIDTDGQIRHAVAELAARGLIEGGAAARTVATDVIHSTFSGWKTPGVPGDMSGFIIGREKETAQRLLELLDDPEWRVRHAATVALPLCGESAWIAEQKLVELAAPAGDSTDSFCASWALRAMGAARHWPLPELRTQAMGGDRNTRLQAIERLGILYGYAGDETSTMQAQSLLAHLLKDPDDEIALKSALALRDRDFGDSSRAIQDEILGQSLSSRPNRLSFFEAIDTGAQADHLITAICALLTDPSPEVRLAVAEYLIRWRFGRWRTEDTAPLWFAKARDALHACIDDPDPRVREAIGRARIAFGLEKAHK